MASSICLRCLSRPLAQAEQSVVRPAIASQTSWPSSSSSSAASFSTSASLSANPPKKKVAVPKQKGVQGKQAFGKQGRVGGKGGARAAGSGGKPPAPGERKAQRKRIVLSNTNALEVQGMEDLTAETKMDASQLGQVLGLTDGTIDSLRAIEAFKPTQGWSMFRRPATLVRSETVAMAQLLDAAATKQTLTRVIYGERGSGKSVLMLQAMAMAFVQKWIVIHIPEANDVTIGHTSYLPDTANPDDITYIQPQYTASLLGAIGKANHVLFDTLQLSQKHDLPIPVQANISLARFCELGARDPDIAWSFYQALWKELSAPGRPPVMFTMDGVNHAMRESAYLNADVEKIHAHDLALVRHFMALLSGKEKLANGGIVLAADAASNRPSVPAFDFALAKNQAIKDGNKTPVWDPYVQVDRKVLQAMEGVDVLQLKGLSRHEAKGIMEYYAKSGMLRYTVNERLLSEKWTVSGGGIIGPLEKASVMLRV